MNINVQEKYVEWQCPPKEADPYIRKGWCDDLVQNGDRWLQSQPGLRNCNEDIKLLMGLDQDNQLKSNSFQADIRTFVETVTDLRQIATMGSRAEQLKKTVALYNDIYRYIFWDSGYLFSYRYALQYGMLSRGYLWTKFSRDHYGWGKGRMVFDWLGPFEVLPEQLPKNNDVQGCYATTIICAMPIAEAHARFPKYQDQLQPIARYEWSKYNTAGGIRLDFWDRARFQGQQDWDNRYALDIDTPIPVPTGWKRMGDLEAGDYVYGGDGSMCRVTTPHPVQTLESFSVLFSDKSSIVCSGDHQWVTRCKKSSGNNDIGEEKVRTTDEIRATIELIHRIKPTCVDPPESFLPIDPYLLGLWLGDGCKTNGELVGLPTDLREIESILHSRGHRTISFTVRQAQPSKLVPIVTDKNKLAVLRIDGFERSLRTYGILGEKRIPTQYLRASAKQRRDLLRGLMDTDGWTGRQTGWGQTNVHKGLAYDFSELLNSLGVKHTMGLHVGERYGREYLWHYTQFSPTFNVFYLSRKANKLQLAQSDKKKDRYIVSIEPVGKREVRCITVNSPDHTFLAGKSLTKTHNCEIRYHFIRDLRMNETGRTLQMGVPGSSWGYEVPSYGDLLVSTNPYNDLPESRKATEEDCLVYPQLRLVITCPTVREPMYDDTAFDWHGEIPLAPIDVNDWAWSPVGYSTIRNVAGLVKAQRRGLSRIDEVLDVRKDPPTGYDLSTGVSRTQMEKIDLLQAQGVRVGLKGDPKKSVVSILPDSIEVTEVDYKGQELYDSSIKASLGLTDITSMRDLKMNMSDQSFDKMLQNLGPIGKGIALNTWKCNRKIAHMLKYNIPQYIPVAELVKMVGPEGVGLETFDNDPNSLIPARLPGENGDKSSRFTKRQRAQWFVEQLEVTSTPMQLLNVTQMQERMTYMFLFQKGAKLPTATYMEKFGIQDYEAQLDLWKAEQISFAQWELEAQAATQAKMKELGLQPPPQQGPGQGQGGGRPGTSQTTPHASLKGAHDGNVRVVTKQSK